MATLAFVLFGSILVSPVANADEAASLTSTPLRLMSREDYESKFGQVGGLDRIQPAVPDDEGGAAPDVRKLNTDPRTPPWHGVLQTHIDRDGHDLPVRQGDALIGFAHYSGKHNLFSDRPISAAVDNQNPVAVDGLRREYLSILTDSWGNQFARIRVINWDHNITADNAFITPDGRPIGTITAFCEGVDRCPDAVNQ